MYRSMQKAFTAERREQLKQLSQMPDIYERLARALGMYVCVHMNLHARMHAHTECGAVYEFLLMFKCFMLHSDFCPAYFYFVGCRM